MALQRRYQVTQPREMKDYVFTRGISSLADTLLHRWHHTLDPIPDARGTYDRSVCIV